MMLEPFALSIAAVVEKLNSNLTDGLTENEVKQRIKKHGKNEIAAKAGKTKLKILMDQFNDPIIFILAVAAVLTFFFNDDLPETIAIITVILITVIIGFIMELQGLRSLEALRKMGITESSVLRDGKIKAIKSSLLVPGDIIIIEAGDVVSADARLITIENLAIKEASLTGESRAILKTINSLPKNTTLPDRTNMLFKGTTVEQGSAKAIVVETGLHTQLGKIQQMGSEVEEQRTPLEKKLSELSKWLIWLTLIFAVLIIFTGYLRGQDMLLIIETAVALAVAAIPEGLPVVATIALARGMLKLSKRQVIIKQMEAVETLGATNIICTDKTGTLTEDKMQVHTLVFEDETVTEIQNKAHAYFNELEKSEAFNAMLMTSMLCNNVILNAEELRGDSIELALIQFAEKVHFNPKKVKEEHPEIMEIPFTTESKLMATLNKNEAKGYTVYVKGAFESVIHHCNTILKNNTSEEFKNKKEWISRENDLASQGLRLLAFAFRNHETKPNKNDLLSELTFIGIIGFLDPAREDVASTIKVYKEAGIKVVMMTGDHPGTARKIAEEIGLISTNATSNSIIHGKDLQFEGEHRTNQTKILDASVFARVTPEQKLKLVQLFQENENVVGMFGDGINDIPALRKADIGIAMGIRGTQAAREAADIVLKNDKFTAMELAISQGRAVFDHVRQFVVYLLSCNLAEVVSVGLAALLGLPAPLLPLQILFLNLVTDIFPALALGMGKGEVDIMKRPPRKANEPILTRKLWSSTIIYGISITAAVVGITAYAYFGLEFSAQIINNMAFYTLVLAQLFNVFNMAENKVSFFKNEVIKNPWVWSAIGISLFLTIGAYYIPPVANALFLINLSLEQIGWVIVFALGSLALSQIIKRLGGTF
ncbi:cation-transporting P-type ATPase [Subsaximicrobium wynnwilliamsii]|uniref:Cation-transporting P-type ATPase n=2 Tax=Subsaximicrobium wynnwilliamsii TaxID=291179 RepID=A0A5C6ZIU1_9FLAO|nr:cation-transporting P-type ATPase [Subsaximicrobium wynnwilliamsii]TXD90148.1 cation-transporting P-type ATPase [Subsaximicrobium wynnwilliamsii]TXE04200.1 cation-transporting P-type ATPase [Subsaximicrobium wynnwilliamsii]